MQVCLAWGLLNLICLRPQGCKGQPKDRSSIKAADGVTQHWQLTNQLVELQSQEIGKKTGDISSAQCFRLYGDIWLGPQALLVLSVESRCCVPDTVIVTLEIDDIGPLELSVGGIYDT